MLDLAWEMTHAVRSGRAAYSARRRWRQDFTGLFGVDAVPASFASAPRVNSAMAETANNADPRPLKVPPDRCLHRRHHAAGWVGALDIMTVACGVSRIAPPTTVSVMTAATAAIGCRFGRRVGPAD